MLTNHLVLGEVLYSPDLPEGETEVQTALDGSKIRVRAARCAALRCGLPWPPAHVQLHAHGRAVHAPARIALASPRPATYSSRVRPAPRPLLSPPHPACSLTPASPPSLGQVINKNGTVTIKTADGVEVKVVVADLEGGNAAVHIISGVLVPSEKPAAESPAAAPKDVPCTITVKPKDTLVTLAKEYGTTVDKLAELNKIKVGGGDREGWLGRAGHSGAQPGARRGALAGGCELTLPCPPHTLCLPRTWMRSWRAPP